MPSIDPHHGMGKERWLEVCQEAKAIRSFNLFQRGVGVRVRLHEPKRMKGAFLVDLPYANISLPVILVFPAKGKGSPLIPCPPDMNDNIPPEIYFQHEKFQGFAPDLMSYAYYGRSPVEPLDRKFGECLIYKRLGGE